MQDNANNQIGPKEDYFVQTTLKVKDREIKNVLCKIFLPDYTTGKPILKFKPTQKQYSQICDSYEGAFEAEIIGFDKKKETTISAPTVYYSDMVKKYWGPEFIESSFKGEPQHLQVVSHLNSEVASRNTELTMWISPNPMLGPALVHTSHFNGNIEYKRVSQLEFILSEELTFKFDKHFKTKELNEGESKQWSYLVACCNLDLPASKVEVFKTKILPKIDDFLLVASLGSRTRTACIGWEAYDHTAITKYYRGNYTFPSGESEPSFDQGLVWQKDFNEFLTICYAEFIKHPNQRAIRDAIISVVPGRKKTLEESYLSMFAGLETLISDFRCRDNFEFVVDDRADWDTIKKSIKKNIFNTIKEKLKKEQRAYIYCKLDELNRVPLQVVFENFCSRYGIDLSDLWPLFKKGEIIGLSDIRNSLIHGAPFVGKYHNALWVAEESLRFMIERILVKILKWPLEKAEVSPTNLCTYSTAIKMMPNEQAKISEYIAHNT